MGVCVVTIDIPGLLLSLEENDRTWFINYINSNKNCIYVIDGGFTPLSERTEGGEFIPCWGKADTSSSVPQPGQGPSDTEIATARDLFQLANFMKNSGINFVIPVITLSDMRWYGCKSFCSGQMPHEKRRDLVKRIRADSIRYIPAQYIEIFGRNFAPTVRVVLQHEYSSGLTHRISNIYSQLKKSAPKWGSERVIAFHKKIFTRNKGWIYVQCIDDNFIYYILSTSVFRTNNHAISKQKRLVTEVLEEGGIIISHGMRGMPTTQQCGSVSAGRILYLVNMARQEFGTNGGIQRPVTTIHIFDAEDDLAIGRKLVRGMLATLGVASSYVHHIAIIKNSEKAELYNIELRSEDIFTTSGLMHSYYDSSINDSTFLEQVNAAYVRIESGMQLKNISLAYSMR
jgi:hypothetical protein